MAIFQCRATLPPSLDSSAVATRLAPYLWTHPYPVLSRQHCFVLDDGSGQAVGYVIGCADVQAMASVYGGYLGVLGVLGGESLGSADAVELDDLDGLDVDPAFVKQARADVGPAPAQLDRLEPWTLPDIPDAPDGPDTTDTTDTADLVNETCLKQYIFSPRWLLLDSAHTPAKRALVAGYGATMHINLLPPAQGGGWGRRMVDTFLASVAGAGARGIHIGVSGENTKVLPFYEKCGFRVEPGGAADGGSVWMVRDLAG